MNKVLFLILSAIALNVHAWTEIPPKHLVCDKVKDPTGKLIDRNCRLVPGPAPDLGFKLEPSDPKEVMSVTKNITGTVTIERRDGTQESFTPDGMGGWRRQ